MGFVQKAAKKQSLPPVRRELIEDGAEGLDYGSVGGTDMGYEAPAAFWDLSVVIDGAGPSRLLAPAVLHSYSIGTTVVERQEYEPGIENICAYLYALSPRGRAIVHKKPELSTALSKSTVVPDWYWWCNITYKVPAAILNPFYYVES